MMNTTTDPTTALADTIRRNHWADADALAIVFAHHMTIDGLAPIIADAIYDTLHLDSKDSEMDWLLMPMMVGLTGSLLEIGDPHPVTRLHAILTDSLHLQ